jgi:hypothetical protein
MSPEPRHERDYATRQVEAARRVLVDVGQVLASFGDAIVVVGGWEFASGLDLASSIRGGLMPRAVQ